MREMREQERDSRENGMSERLDRLKAAAPRRKDGKPKRVSRKRGPCVEFSGPSDRAILLRMGRGEKWR